MTKIVLYGALFSLISLSAQDTAAIEKKLAEANAQMDGIKVLGAAMVNGPTVKGAPYSAQAENTMEQMLADGNRIKHTNSSMLYRDSQGRERREEASGSAFITDPVESATYILEPGSKTAQKTAQRTVGFAFSGGYSEGAGGGVGVGRGGAGVMTEAHTFTVSSAGSGPETFVFSNQEVRTSKANTNVEHLGMQTIEGVAAEGTRTTVTIPAGQIGNDKDIVTTTERWYSPELQVTIMNKRTDPRTGTSTYKLTSVNRSEPSPALFQVPSDYTLREPEIRRTIIDKPEERL